jgi:GDSL-like Lipase/Acylhydrolase family
LQNSFWLVKARYIGLEKGQVGVQHDSKRAGFGVNLLICVLAIALALGALELFARAFVTVRNVGPAFTVYDPIYGKRMKANLHATRIAPEFRFDINTNSLGMRDPEPAKPVTDGVVFVGDSFTEGYGVQDNEVFPARIRAALQSRGVSLPVLNTGMGNNGNGRWVKFFDHDAGKFRPRIVVFQVMANDFDDNLDEHLFQLDGNGTLRELPIGPPSLARKVETLVDDTPGLPYSRLVSLMWTAEAAAAKGATPSADTDDLASDQLTYALIRTAVDKARAGGADVIGLLVGLTGPRRAKVMEIFRQRGLTCLDGPNRHDAPDMFYKIDGHWNAAGHRRAAELLLPEILRRAGPPQNNVE